MDIWDIIDKIRSYKPNDTTPLPYLARLMQNRQGLGAHLANPGTASQQFRNSGYQDLTDTLVQKGMPLPEVLSLMEQGRIKDQLKQREDEREALYKQQQGLMLQGGFDTMDRMNDPRIKPYGWMM